jgi:hypothetical protein
MLPGNSALASRSSPRSGSDEAFPFSDCRCDRRSAAVRKTARCGAPRRRMRWLSWLLGSRSSARSFCSTRQRGQRQFGLSFMTGLQACGSTVTERGTGSAVWAFREMRGTGILREHIVSRKLQRVLRFWGLASIPAKNREANAGAMQKLLLGVVERPRTRGVLEMPFRPVLRFPEPSAAGVRRDRACARHRREWSYRGGPPSTSTCALFLMVLSRNRKGPPTSSEGLRFEHIRTQVRWTPALAREQARWALGRRDRACARHRRGRTTT